MNTRNERGSLAQPWLVDVVAECLKIAPCEIEAGVPLTRYGLDSLASAELVSALSARLGRELPDWLLFDCPDILSLDRFLGCEDHAASMVGDIRLARVESMRADAVLPPEIRPAPPTPCPAGRRSILLTGATGFLGAHLLQALLQQDGSQVVCLVRPEGSMGGEERLRRVMRSHGMGSAAGGRVEAVEGDLQLPRFGLSEARFDELGRRISEVYHCGAAVNWILPYESIRDINVKGTLEILRLACQNGARPVHFVSTIGVCLATPGPRSVSENDDMLAHLEGLHFGYVQSKCVAEALMKHAAERGLPVTIYRPTLIAGHSRSGRFDSEGFLSSFLKGCVQMECAPDLDWVLDCCPVDYIARSISRLAPTDARSLRVYHLDNVRPRHWRECVLWMNLYGYRVRLVSFADWLERLEVEASGAGHALHSLQAFFRMRPPGLQDLALPELYEEQRKSHVRSLASRRELDRLTLTCPPLEAGLLDRYFESFVQAGFLHRPVEQLRRPRRPRRTHLDTGEFTEIFRTYYGDRSLTVDDARAIESRPDTGSSIINELAAWRHGHSVGLFPHQVEVRRSGEEGPMSIRVMVKIKPRDRDVVDIGRRVAELCGPDLGHAYSRHKEMLGLDACHLRELAIYEQRDERFLRHTPTCYGNVRDDRRRRWVLVLEHLSDTLLMDSADDVGGWHHEHVEAAVRGLATLHSIWFRREEELMAQPWLGEVPSARNMAASVELWSALADHAGPLLQEWIGPGVRQLQREFIESIPAWWGDLEAAPRTLIHNDFNPRNLTFRRGSSEPQLCVYDWELATLGVPQHDLAEVLSFVLGPGTSADELHHYVELHRRHLARATDREIDPSAWHRVFAHSLRDLLLNRFAMYALINTFRPQRFLRRVVHTWHAMYHHCASVLRDKPGRGSRKIA